MRPSVATTLALTTTDIIRLDKVIVQGLGASSISPHPRPTERLSPGNGMVPVMQFNTTFSVINTKARQPGTF